MTDYHYMVAHVEEFLHDLRAADRELGEPLLRRFWYCISVGVIEFGGYPKVEEFTERFHKLSYWERANVMFGLTTDINEAATAAAKFYVGLARLQNEGGRHDPDAD